MSRNGNETPDNRLERGRFDARPVRKQWENAPTGDLKGRIEEEARVLELQHT